MTPTTLPTPVPTLAFAREPFNCSRYNNPIQVMRVDGTYRVVELDFATGTYTLIYELDWMHASAHTNAVGLVNARIGGVKQNYLLGAFSTELCFFDGEGKACFDGTLDHSAPNAGVVVGSDYYYTKSLGDSPNGQTKIFLVKDVDTKSPVFSTAAAVAFSMDLWYAGLVDITGVVEGGREVFDDGDDSATYLVGLETGATKLVVIRIDASTRLPDRYAVLRANLNWQETTPITGKSLFGSAFSYPISGKWRVFFASNDGWGLFELMLPLTVPSSCFNTGTDSSTHTICKEKNATLVWRSNSDSSANNDGLNCPANITVSSTFYPSPVPTTAVPSMIPTAAPTAVPTAEPTSVPTTPPSPEPTTPPSPEPTSVPTTPPTGAPTTPPSPEPTGVPFAAPTAVPTAAPTSVPSTIPTAEPTAVPTTAPTSVPSTIPTSEPTIVPTTPPSPLPSPAPTGCFLTQPAFKKMCLADSPCAVTWTYTGPATDCLDVDVTCFRDNATLVGPLTTPNDGAFSFDLPYGIQGGIYGVRVACTDGTCVDATRRLVVAYSFAPTGAPSPVPSSMPTSAPTATPTSVPTPTPTRAPTAAPTFVPTTPPSSRPSGTPTNAPTFVPTTPPSSRPSGTPTNAPTFVPTTPPSSRPSGTPTTAPTFVPTTPPSPLPSPAPTGCFLTQPTDLDCVADLPCPVTWTYTGPATSCLDVDVTCFRDDATIVGPLTTPNDGAFSFDLPYGTNIGVYGVHVACTDGTCVDATRPLAVLYTWYPTGVPSPVPSSMPTTRPSPAPSFLPSPTPTLPPTREASLAPTIATVAIDVSWSARRNRTSTRLSNATATTAGANASDCDPLEFSDGVAVAEDYLAELLGVERSRIGHMVCADMNVTAMPTVAPAAAPSSMPTTAPPTTVEPTTAPSSIPSSSMPSEVPTAAPTPQPTIIPSSAPTPLPTNARRRLLDDQCFSTNTTTIITSYVVTVVLPAVELPVYTGGSGSVIEVAEVFETVMTATFVNATFKPGTEVCSVTAVATKTVAPSLQPVPFPTTANPSFMPTTSKPTTAQPSPFPSISPLPTIQPTTLDPPDPPVNVTLDPDTSETAWTDEGYGGEAATYLLYDGDVLAVAVDAGDRRLRRRRLARVSNRERHDRNRTHGETDGFNKDGSKREWDAKKGWRRRTAETLSFALEENVACFSTVTLTVVAENNAGASEPSDEVTQTLNGCWRDPTHVPTTGAPTTAAPSVSPIPSPFPTISPAPTATPAPSHHPSHVPSPSPSVSPLPTTARPSKMPSPVPSLPPTMEAVAEPIQEDQPLLAAVPGGECSVASVAPAAFGGAAVAVAAGVKASHARLVGFPLAAQFVLAGGLMDTGGDLYFICDRRRRANEGEEVLEEERRRLTSSSRAERALRLSIYLWIAHALVNLLILIYLAYCRPDVWDDRPFAAYPFTKIMIWACAILGKIEIGVVLPWKASEGHQRYDVVCDDGTVWRKVRHGFLRSHRMDDDDGDDKGAPPSPDHHFIGGLGPEDSDDDETFDLVYDDDGAADGHHFVGGFAAGAPPAAEEAPHLSARMLARTHAWAERHREAREDIHAFYAKHNPEKVKEAPALIDKYKAKGVHEPELLEAIVKKYTRDIHEDHELHRCDIVQKVRAASVRDLKVESPPVTPDQPRSLLPRFRAAGHAVIAAEKLRRDPHILVHAHDAHALMSALEGREHASEHRVETTAKELSFRVTHPHHTLGHDLHHDLEHQASHLGHVGHGVFEGLSHMAHGLEHQASRLGRGLEHQASAMGRRLVHAVKAHHRLKEGQRVAFHHPARDGRVVHGTIMKHHGRHGKRVEKIGFPDSRFCALAALSSGGFAVLHFLVKFRAYQEDPSDNAARLCAAINGLVVLATIGLAIDMWRRAYRNKHPKPHKAAKPTKKQWKPRACCMDDTTDDTIIDVQIDDRDDLDGLMRALDEPVPPKKKKIKPRPPLEPPEPEPSSPSVEDALMRALETPVPVDQPAPPPKKKKIKPRPPLEPPPPPEAEPIEPPPPPAEPSSPSVDDLRRRFEPPHPHMDALQRKLADVPPPPPGSFAASATTAAAVAASEAASNLRQAAEAARRSTEALRAENEARRRRHARMRDPSPATRQRRARSEDRATARVERGRSAARDFGEISSALQALPPRVMARTRTLADRYRRGDPPPVHPALSPVRGLYDASEEAKADAVTLTVDDDDEGVAEAKAEAKAEAVTLTIEDDDDDDDEGVAEAKDDDPLTRDDEAAIYRVKEEAAPEEPAPSVADLAARFGPTRPRRSTADDIEAMASALEPDAEPDAPPAPPRPRGRRSRSRSRSRARFSRARGEQRLERSGGVSSSERAHLAGLLASVPSPGPEDAEVAALTSYTEGAAGPVEPSRTPSPDEEAALRAYATPMPDRSPSPDQVAALQNYANPTPSTPPQTRRRAPTPDAAVLEGLERYAGPQSPGGLRGYVRDVYRDSWRYRAPSPSPLPEDPPDD